MVWTYVGVVASVMQVLKRRYLQLPARLLEASFVCARVSLEGGEEVYRVDDERPGRRRLVWESV